MSEEKKIFDKKFVYFMWDDSLKDKEGFVAPTIRLLIDCVENGVYTNHWQKLAESHDTDLPFHSITGSDYGFSYYDPLYKIKLAWKQGKVIQSRNPTVTDQWSDVDNPQWLGICEYRVKPEKKWRPFKDIQELKQTWLAKNGAKSKGDLYEPFIWVRSKANSVCTRMLTGFLDESNAEEQAVSIGAVWNPLDALFRQWEFLDGTPCGVEE